MKLSLKVCANRIFLMWKRVFLEEKPELKKEVKLTENETENVKRSLEQEAFMRDSAEKPSNLIAAANVRGMFMNEHISKEEYLKSQDKKRKMKEILEYFTSII